MANSVVVNTPERLFSTFHAQGANTEQSQYARCDSGGLGIFPWHAMFVFGDWYAVAIVMLCIGSLVSSVWGLGAASACAYPE